MGVGAGLYMYVVVVQKFTFAISSPDEFLSVIQQWLVGDVLFHLKWPIEVTHPFKNRSCRQISACNVSKVRYSEKKFNYDE